MIVWPWTVTKDHVRFGAPVEEAFKNGMPGGLLMLLLKVHQDGQITGTVFRIPGRQQHIKILIRRLKRGRLFNVDNYSVHTCASVIKRFLSMLKYGVFGHDTEGGLLEAYALSPDHQHQFVAIQKCLKSLPAAARHFLVLLFGTFYQIAVSKASKLTSAAISVAVAPSLFPLGRDAFEANKRRSSIARLQLGSGVIDFIISHFGSQNLFSPDDYRYYADITGQLMEYDRDRECYRFSSFSEQIRRESLVHQHCEKQWEEVRQQLSIELDRMNAVSPAPIDHRSKSAPHGLLPLDPHEAEDLSRRVSADISAVVSPEFRLLLTPLGFPNSRSLSNNW